MVFHTQDRQAHSPPDKAGTAEKKKSQTEKKKRPKRKYKVKKFPIC